MNKRFQLERKSHLGVASNSLRKVAKAAVLMVAVLALGGCSADSAAGTTQSAEASAQSESAAKSANVSGESTAKNSETATGQGQGGSQKGGFVRADLMGEVKSIVGNSVTLALAKVPTREGGTGAGAGAGTGAGTGTGTPPTGGEMPSGGGAPPEGAGAPPSAGGASGSGGQSTGGQRSANAGAGNPGAGGQGGTGAAGATGTRRAISLTLTGETKEILIPVGISITSGNGDNAKTIDIADIEKGDVLMIYYVEGTEDIEKITVR